MATKIADDAADIARRLKDIENGKQAARRGHPDIIPEDHTMSYMGHLYVQSWTDKQVQDGLSPPLDQLERVLTPNGNYVWQVK